MVIHETLGPQAPLILGAILIITGLALAFFGHGIVSSLMSLIGALLGSAVGYLFGAAIGQSPLLVLLVVFALAYYYIDDLIGIITAAIGGLLLFGGLFILNVTPLTAGLAGAGVFVLGALVQTSKIRRKRQMKAATAAAAALPPPPPP